MRETAGVRESFSFYIDLMARVRADIGCDRSELLLTRGLVRCRACASIFRLRRPSIASEILLRAMLLQAYYSVLSERLQFDLLFRWFVGRGVDEPA